jgi:hypothetical protein
MHGDNTSVHNSYGFLEKKRGAVKDAPLARMRMFIQENEKTAMCFFS